MSSSKTIAIAMALLMAVPVLTFAFADDSDADSTVTVTARGYRWFRTAEPVEYDSSRYSSGTFYCSTTNVDDKVSDYLHGSISNDDIGFVSSGSLVNGTSYYVYFSENNRWANFCDESLINYQLKEIKNDVGYLFISTVSEKITVNSIGGSHSSVTLYNVSGWTDSTLSVGNTKTFDYYQDYTYCLIVQEECANFSVDLTISDGIKVLSTGTPTERVMLSTNKAWISTQITTSGGRFNNTYNDEYFFPVGSEIRQKFIDDVINASASTVPAEFDIYRVGYDTSQTFNGTYEYFKLADSYNRYFSISNGTINKYDSNPTVYENKTPSSISFFVPAGKELHICVEYDSSNATMRLLANGSYTNFVLASGVEYVIPTKTANQYGIVVSNANSYGFEVMYSVSGNSEPDENAVSFAVIVILICVPPFGLLLLSARKPAWCK